MKTDQTTMNITEYNELNATKKELTMEQNKSGLN